MATLTELKALLADSGLKGKAIQEALSMIDDIQLKQFTSRQRVDTTTDENGNTLYWCRYHKKYYLQEDMVFSNGKSKGYSKSAIAVWNKNNQRCKNLNESLSSYVSSHFHDLNDEKVKAEIDRLRMLIAEAKASLSVNWEGWTNVEQHEKEFANSPRRR